VTGALGIIVWLIGVSGGLFVLIGLLVLAPGRAGSGRGVRQAMGLGGPRGADWAVRAETAEPGRRVGGASATW
jgi:hypothetical protein